MYIDTSDASSGRVCLNAAVADKLSVNAGSLTQPIYFSNGVPTKTTYTLGASVPSNAKFTDTTYSNATTSKAGLMSADDKFKLDNTNVACGTCSTAADVAAKVITLNGNTKWALTSGSIIMIKFDVSNTASGVTLNVNNTGAYPIWYNNAEYTGSSSAYTGYKDRTITYAFNGTHWVWISSSYDANSDTKVEQSAAITTDGEYPVILAYSTSTSKVTNTLKKSSTLKYNPSTKVLTAPTFKGNLTGNADTASNIAWSGVTEKPDYYDAKAITSIKRSGTTFTATHLDGTTSTFTQQDNNTTYSAGAGLSLDSTTFKHSNSITAKTAYAQSATKSPGYAGTFNVYEPKYDAQGHITGVQAETITMPSAQTLPTAFTITATATDDDVIVLTGTNGSNKVTFDAKHAKKGPTTAYTSGNKTTSISGSGGTGTIKIPQISVDTYGHVTAAADESVSITLPTIPTTLKNPKALTVGSKSYDGSTAVEIVAADLGLSNAMHFRGTVSSKPANTTGYVDGDVILVGNKEYVCSNSAWIELGDESSFKVKQSAVNSPSASGTTTSFIDTITQNANGVISATKKTIPDANTSTKGIAKLHLAANCSTYSSDDGGATPAAVKKAVELFSLVHGGTADGNITIANSETLQSKQPILQWTTVGENTPRMGFAQDQSDGTFIICSLKGTDSYTNGLAIGGGSGNLLWKGVKVLTASDNYAGSSSAGGAATSANKVNKNLIVKLNGGATEGTNLFTFNGSAAKTINITPAGIGASASGHTHNITYAKSAAATGSTTQGGTNAETSITPAGTVSQPTFTGIKHNHTFTGSSHNHTLTPTTATIYSISNVGTMFTASVSGEVLTLTAGSAPSRESKTVYTGLTIAAATQGGTIADTTAGGTVSQPTFTGTAASHTHTFTGKGHTHTITLTDTTVTSTGG